MTFKVSFHTDDATVLLEGEYRPPPCRGEGYYGNFIVRTGHVVAREPFQMALADNIDGHTIDAIVGRAMARVGRATW